jgi:hypothetical protein
MKATKLRSYSLECVDSVATSRHIDCIRSYLSVHLTLHGISILWLLLRPECLCMRVERFAAIPLIHTLPMRLSGLGSKPLSASWDATVRLLLETRKPLICTAHGEADLSSDLNFLNKVSGEEDSQDIGEPLEFLIPPHLNPFRSLKRVLDKKAPEFSDGRIITTNCYIYAVRSK